MNLFLPAGIQTYARADWLPQHLPITVSKYPVFCQTGIKLGNLKKRENPGMAFTLYRMNILTVKSQNLLT
jgi:hypothetical protein